MERHRGRTRRRDSFRSDETVAALHRRPSNGVGFGGIPIRFCLFSAVCREEKFPSLPNGAAGPTVGPLRRAREGEHSGDRARRTLSDGERAARSRDLADLRQPPSRGRRLDLPASGTTSGGGVSGRAWPRRILVIGGRRKRVARLHIFRNIISQISKSGPQMCFRTRLLVSCHSRVSGNPGPRHVWPSLDARFRGHDTDVSESSPHFQRLRRPV